VDEYFSRLESSTMKETASQDYNKTVGKLLLIKEKQHEALGRLHKEAEEHQKAGNLIYQNLEAVDRIIEQVKKARKQGLGDKEITERFAQGKRKGIPEAKLFKKLDKSRLTLELE
ncbi:MAG: hypothetical protein V1703_05010, partial [Candidatus Altiarchaeota archaeon]